MITLKQQLLGVISCFFMRLRSSRHEKYCQMSVRLFSLFRGSIYQQCFSFGDCIAFRRIMRLQLFCNEFIVLKQLCKSSLYYYQVRLAVRTYKEKLQAKNLKVYQIFVSMLLFN